ncbi:MAG: AMIN domain-containing protein, partial [Gemmatimonadetes bacterium]|nr:AMIN domain-containing protein [Gemmatimonadota bacterium]
MTRRSWRAARAAAVLILLVTGVRVARAAAASHEGAPTAVTSLSVVPGAGAANVVISVAGDVEVTDFTLENPRRIVIDLRGATLGMPARLYDKVARGGITDIKYAMFKPDVVRIVLILDESREYTVVRGEKDVTVAVTGSDVFALWHVGAKLPATKATDAAAAVAPAQPAKGASAFAQAPAKAASATTFVQSPPPTGTPSAPADATSAAPAARNILSKPVAKPAPRLESPAEEPHITVSYQETNIRDVITAFAKFSNRTIIIGKQVDGFFTGDIIDKPWDVALRQILQSQGLAALEDSSNGIITVDSYANLADREKVEPLVTKVIQVNYAKADAMAKTVTSLLTAGCGSGGAAPPAGAPPQGGGASVSGGGTAACSTRGAVTSEEKTNTIIVTETAQRLADIESYVHDLDVRTPQVSIKAKIIGVDRTGTEQLGLSYDFGSANGFSNSLVQRYGPDGTTPIVGDYRVNLA